MGGTKRGVQLLLGMVAMVAVSSPQYTWALFVAPAQESLRTSLAALQVTIALFSIFQCGFGPLHGVFAHRFRPAPFVAFGGALVGVSWVLSSFVTSLPVFYLTYGVLSGIGSGIVFVCVTNLMGDWFPERRGFAIGMVAGSYGMGAIVTTFPIDALIKAYGYQTALLVMGVALGVVGGLAGAGLRSAPSPAPAQGLAQPDAPGGRDYTPSEMLRTPIFWLLFVMMTMVGAGGLMAISQIAVFARTFGIGPNTLVFGLAALPLALTLDRLCNGVSRPLFGAISDRLGREPTMALAFTLGALGTLALLHFGHNPLAFVLLTGIVFLGWGEIFSLFPAHQADIFGRRHGAKNLGYLLIAIAVASLLGGPLAAYVFQVTGTWSAVFYIVAGLNLGAAALALLVLKPMSARLTAPPPAQAQPVPAA